MISRAILAGTLVPRNFNHTALVAGEILNKGRSLILQVGGLGVGPIISPCKKLLITETSTRLEQQQPMDEQQGDAFGYMHDAWM